MHDDLNPDSYRGYRACWCAGYTTPTSTCPGLLIVVVSQIYAGVILTPAGPINVALFCQQNREAFREREREQLMKRN